MSFLKKINRTFGIIVFAAVACVTLIAQADWQEPPTTGNVEAPVTAGEIGQVKLGLLSLPRLAVLGDTASGFVKIGGLLDDLDLLPTEKLDLKGDTRIDGIIKPDGDAGLDGQILAYEYDANFEPQLLWKENSAWLNLTSNAINPNCDLDNVCEAEELCSTCGDCACQNDSVCQLDTGACLPPSCGDNICQTGESGICPEDCKYYCILPSSANAICGNGICEWGERISELAGSCIQDCPCGGDACGDGKVSGGETCDPPSYPSNPPAGACRISCDTSCHAYVECGYYPYKPPGPIPPPVPVPPPPTTCKNNASTGAPQCGGTCPNPGETCQDNNGSSPGGLCECLGEDPSLPPLFKNDASPQLANNQSITSYINSLTDLVNALVSRVSAVDNSACVDIVQPAGCSQDWSQFDLICVSQPAPIWIRTCFKPFK